MKSESVGAGRAVCAAALLALLVCPARPALASVLDVCDVSARIRSIEELPVLGAGSRKIVDESDPSTVRFNSFVTTMTLEILDAIPYAPSTECSIAIRGSVQQVVLQEVPDDLAAGDEIDMVRELYVDLTPEGVVYEVIWSIPFDRQPGAPVQR